MKLFFYFLILSSLYCLNCLSAYSEELKFLSNDFPPYTYSTDKGGAGAMHDIVMEIVHRLGYKNSVEFVPWARARFEAENNSNIIIIPLARTKDREEKYTWLLHVLDDPYVIVAMKDSKVDISTIEAAKKLKIGILSGSVADSLLHELNFSDIEPVTNDVQNVKKLKLGRIDAWVAPLSCIGQYKDSANIGKEDFRVGIELTKLNEYIGASKSFNKNTIELWNKTFSAMKKDGTYQSIMKKYGMTPLK
jgi:polar amino acid transport system substrate-binding protein